MACRDSGRISSARASTPSTRPSASTCSTVVPAGMGSWEAGSPVSSSSFGPPTRICRPSTVAVTPTAADEVNSVAAGIESPRSRAAVTMARASGCSDGSSAAAASASTSSPPVAATTTGCPLVRVPVLSNSTASTVRICSSARRSLISTPPRAARSVAMDTTSGIARPSACGQAMTSTVMARMTA